MDKLVACFVLSCLFNFVCILSYCGTFFFDFRRYSLTYCPYVIVRRRRYITRSVIASGRPFQDFTGSNICKYSFIPFSLNCPINFLRDI